MAGFDRRGVLVAVAISALGCAPALPVTPVVTAVLASGEHPPGVDPLTPEERLVALLTEDNPGIERVAISLARMGDPVTRREAGQRLAALGRTITSRGWSPAREGGEHRERGLDGRPVQVLGPILAAMGHLGGPAVDAFAFGLAEDEGAPLSLRRLAIRTLERTVAPGDEPRVARMRWVEGRLPAPARGARPADIVGFLRRAAKTCYERALVQDPGLVTVQARLELRFATDGTVSSSAEGTAPEDLRRCLVLAANRFQATEGAELAPQLTFPIRFLKH